VLWDDKDFDPKIARFSKLFLKIHFEQILPIPAGNKSPPFLQLFSLSSIQILQIDCPLSFFENALRCL
jgi:hypothetical protein